MACTTKSSRPQSALQAGEQRVEARLVLDVGLLARSWSRASRPSAARALAERRALVGEGQLGAGAMQRLGDAPGDRALVGHAHDQAALAGHQLGHGGQRDGLGDDGRRAPAMLAAGGIGGGGEGRSSGIVSPSVVVAREQQAGVGAAEAEAVRHHGLQARPCRCAGGRSDSRSTPGSRFSMLAEAATKSSFIISSE